MKKVLICFIILILAGWHVYGQSNPWKAYQGRKIEGYIVTKGDTIENGYILLRDKLTSQRKVIFVNAEGEKHTYKPRELKGYGYAEYYFESVLHQNTGREFNYRQINGPVKLYLRAIYNGGHVQIDEFLQRENKSILYINRLRYRAPMADYFADFPELALDIKKRKYFKDQTADIVNRYNEWKRSRANANDVSE